MFSIEKTTEFDKWLKNLKDKRAKAKVLFRIQRIEEHGHFGDCQPVGQGMSELRINFAKGYRIYWKKVNNTIVLLLTGGEKSTQQADISKAKFLWEKYQGEKE